MTGPITMRNDSIDSRSEEKRFERRSATLQSHRIEIKLAGAPLYQFKVTDLSTTGAGILINENSDFLQLIDVGKVMDATFISPKGLDPSGMYRVEIRHITQMESSRYTGLKLVGIRILDRRDPSSD
jgi:hypothetical protein